MTMFPRMTTSPIAFASFGTSCMASSTITTAEWASTSGKMLSRWITAGFKPFITPDVARRKVVDALAAADGHRVLIDSAAGGGSGKRIDGGLLDGDMTGSATDTGTPVVSVTDPATGDSETLALDESGIDVGRFFGGAFADDVADDHRSRGNPDAHREDGPVAFAHIVVERRHCFDDGQSRPDGPSGIVFVGLRVAEVDQQTVAEVLGHVALVAFDDLGTHFLICSHDRLQVFRVELLG